MEHFFLLSVTNYLPAFYDNKLLTNAESIQGECSKRRVLAHEMRERSSDWFFPDGNSRAAVYKSDLAIISELYCERNSFNLAESSKEFYYWKHIPFLIFKNKKRGW